MKKLVFVLFVLSLFAMLSACGEQSQEDVVKKLDKKLDTMDGYKVKADMKMNTGQDSQVYHVDIWHQKKDYYRVALTNEDDEKGNQIILKNKDGVFVLTPALNKSFKFQTNWPDNSSQPYLFQSLVNDIKKDQDATFKATDTHYIFQTKTNYQSNNNLPYQEIHFDKKTLTPVEVKVLDKDKNPLVTVTFSKFNTKPKFNKDDFAMNKNMPQSSDDQDEATMAQGAEEPFTVVFPLQLEGAKMTEKKEVNLDNGKRVIMTFKGEKNFTLIEEQKDTVATLAEPREMKGEMVNLGHTMGALNDSSIEWVQDGVNFYLASDQLTKGELIDVAKSVHGKEVK